MRVVEGGGGEREGSVLFFPVYVRDIIRNDNLPQFRSSCPHSQSDTPLQICSTAIHFPAPQNN